MARNSVLKSGAYFLLVVSFLSQAAFAAEIEAQARIGVGTSDNIQRTAQDQIDESILSTGFDFSATEATRRLDLDLRSSFDYLYYVDGTYDSELVGGLAAIAVIHLIEERLDWVFQDNYGQQLFDPLQPARPDNRENINFFTTGPSLTLFPVSRNFVNMDARWSQFRYEESITDNERLSGLISVGREISRTSSMSLNMAGERIEFDEHELYAPLDRYSVFGRFESEGRFNTIGINLGYNEVESSGIKADGVLAVLDWRRQTSANGEFFMSAGSRYSDQGNVFRFLQDANFELRDTNDLPESAEPFLNTFVVLTYALEHSRYNIDLSSSWSKEDYESDLEEDRDLFRVDLRAQRDLSRTVFLSADIGFRRREFQNSARRDDDLSLGIGAGYRFSSFLSGTFDYQHFQRDSVEVNGDFSENRFFLSLLYVPKWSR